MIKKLNYFGTALDRAGHFIWEIYPKGVNYLCLKGLETWGFSPEYLNQNSHNGTVNYVTFNNIKIIAITGSCYDKRGNSKSVFWTEENIPFEELKEAILTFSYSKAIIEQMPFKIKWGKTP